MKKEILRAMNLYVDAERGSSIENLNLSIFSSEVIGFFSNRYSGKSALFNAFEGKTPPRSGTLLWPGAEEGAPAAVSRVGKYSSLVGEMSIGDCLALLWKKHSRSCGRYNVRKTVRFAELYLLEFGIAYDRNMPVSELSQMEKLMLEAALSLRSNPSLAIIDLGGIEGSAAEYGRLFKLLQKIKELDIAVILSGYEPEIILSLSDKVAVLFDGRILKLFGKDDVTVKTLSEIMNRLSGLDNSHPPVAIEDKTCHLEIVNVPMGQPERFSVKLYNGEILSLISPDSDFHRRLLTALTDRREWTDDTHIYFMGNEVRSLDLNKVCFLDARHLETVVPGMSPVENLCLGLSQKTGVYASRGMMSAVAKDFAEWYGSEKLLQYGNSKKLYKKDRIAINLFRLKLQRPSVLICGSLGANNDVVTMNMIMTTFTEMAQNGTAVCVVSTNVAGVADRITRFEVVDNVQGGLDR